MLQIIFFIQSTIMYNKEKHKIYTLETWTSIFALKCIKPYSIVVANYVSVNWLIG